MTNRRPYMPVVIALVTLAAIAVLIVYANRNDADNGHEPAPTPTSAPVTVTETRPNDAMAVHKPYAVPVELPDGRTAVCVFNNAGALACKWPDTPAPATGVNGG